MQKATVPIGVASNKKEALETAMKNIERTYGKGSTILHSCINAPGLLFTWARPAV